MKKKTSCLVTKGWGKSKGLVQSHLQAFWKLVLDSRTLPQGLCLSPIRCWWTCLSSFRGGGRQCSGERTSNKEQCETTKEHQNIKASVATLNEDQPVVILPLIFSGVRRASVMAASGMPQFATEIRKMSPRRERENTFALESEWMTNKRVVQRETPLQ